MADFAGLVHAPIDDPVVYYVADPADGIASPEAFERVVHEVTGDDAIAENLLTEMFNLVPGGGKTDHTAGAVFAGLFSDVVAPDFFENFHVVPRSFDFGNVLSTQTSPLEVFSGFRKEFRTWSSFTNNAGAGTTLLGVPSLPAVMNPLDGYLMTLEVTTVGNPTVDDDLAFEFDFGGVTINVPIVLNRIVLFPVKPELPYRERMQFKTDIIPHEDGGSQRIKVRKNPRQLMNWNVRMEDGFFDKQKVDSLLFDWQARTWGLPMWHEATQLTVAATAGALTINVESTADADYRVGGLALIFADGTLFDVQTIDSFTATTITFENAILNSFPVRSAVVPLRTANMREDVQGSRFPNANQDLQISFRVLDNDSDLADATGWPTYNGLVLLEDCNVLRGGSLSESFVRRIVLTDNGTGLTQQDGPWAYGKRGYPLTLRANSRAEVWDLRQLMHYFGGRQLSFYVPTFGKDLTPTGNLLALDSDLDIVNIGFTQHVQNRGPKRHIWIRLNDGTTLQREITSSTEIDDDNETLVVDTVWPSEIDVADIDRISYLEEVHYNSDEINIEYVRGNRQVYFEAPVITSFDNP